MLSQTCLVVPCYNEEDRLAVDVFLDFVQEKEEYAFVFVNDGSKDKTLQLIESMQARYPEQIKVVDLEQNSGKAEAVRQGMLAALAWKAFDFVGFFDADLATPLPQVAKLLAPMLAQDRFMLATGARVRRLGSDIHRKPTRHFFGRIFATVVSFMLGVAVYDTQCGAKVFRAKVVEQLFNQPFSSKWFFDVEIFARIAKSDYDIEQAVIEVPLDSWRDVGGSKIKMSTFFKVPFDLWRIYRKYRPLKSKKKASRKSS